MTPINLKQSDTPHQGLTPYHLATWRTDTIVTQAGQLKPLVLSKDDEANTATLRILVDAHDNAAALYQREKDGTITYQGPEATDNKGTPLPPLLSGKHISWWDLAEADTASEILKELALSDDVLTFAQLISNEGQANNHLRSINAAAAHLADARMTNAVNGNKHFHIKPSTLPDQIERLIAKELTDPDLVKLATTNSPKKDLTVERYNFMVKNQQDLEETNARYPGLIALMAKTDAKPVNPDKNTIANAVMKKLGLTTPNEKAAFTTGLENGLWLKANPKRVAKTCHYAGQKTPEYAGTQKPHNITKEAITAITWLVNQLPDPYATSYRATHRTRDRRQHWQTLLATFVRDHRPDESEEDLAWLTQHLNAPQPSTYPNLKPDHTSWQSIRATAP